MFVSFVWGVCIYGENANVFGCQHVLMLSEASDSLAYSFTHLANHLMNMYKAGFSPGHCLGGKEIQTWMTYSLPSAV